MSGAARVLFVIAGVVLVIGLAVAAYFYAGIVNETAALSAALGGLETENAQLSADVENLEGWNSYQSTQIGAQQAALRDLMATAQMAPGGIQDPTFTPTPWDQHDGVLIEEGSCCVGGIAGDTIDVVVNFLPHTAVLEGEVVEMRVISGPANVTLADMVNQPWEPIETERVYQVYVPINWTTFWVHVQYRNAAGAESWIYSDEIGVEGMPGFTPTP